MFYLCSNGVLYNLTCPAGLLFDSNLKKCETASNVVCTDGLTTTAFQTITTTIQTTTITPGMILIIFLILDSFFI